MIANLHILTVGFPQTEDFFREGDLNRTCRIFRAPCGWDLSVVPTFERVDIVILHADLPAAEICSCTGYVRRRWPGAGILLIRSQADIDDPMYDERVPPGVSIERLLATSEELATQNQNTGAESLSGCDREDKGSCRSERTE